MLILVGYYFEKVIKKIFEIMYTINFQIIIYLESKKLLIVRYKMWFSFSNTWYTNHMISP